MKHIAFIYPYLTSYIFPVIRKIAESDRVKFDVIFGPLPAGEGFENYVLFDHPNVSWIQLKEKQPFGNRFGMFQSGILRYLIKKRHDSIVIWSNPRYLSFWVVLIFGYLFGTPVYARGHGLFKKERINLFYNVMYKLLLALVNRYICYTPQVKSSLLTLVKREDKLVVDNNTLYNEYPVLPKEKTGEERGIFYIGRVRPGCGVDTLIQAVNRINQEVGIGVELHIIGDGPLGEFVRQQAYEFSWIKYYGKLFDEKRISDISRKCRFGCVPGFMGLNVVHMMSLSLPVVTHGDLKKHLGPEPEYIKHGKNGWLIDKPNDVVELTDALRLIRGISTADMNAMQFNAFQKYFWLSNPPFHERLMQIWGV